MEHQLRYMAQSNVSYLHLSDAFVELSGLNENHDTGIN